MAAPICIACDGELERGRCRAEAFDGFVGREGRHGGACWDGRFPTTEEHRAWAKEQRRRAERRHAAAEPDVDEQLALDVEP